MKLYQVLFSNSKPIAAHPTQFPDLKILTVKRIRGKYRIISLAIYAGNECESLRVANQVVKDNFTFIFSPPFYYNPLDGKNLGLN